MKPDPVIVRQWKDNGELIAIFPCDPSDYSDIDHCESLDVRDGWGGMSIDVALRLTRPVSDDLALSWLERYQHLLPYQSKYRVMRRMSRAMHAERERRWRNA